MELNPVSKALCVHWYRPLNNMFCSVGQSQVSPASVHGKWPTWISLLFRGFEGPGSFFKKSTRSIVYMKQSKHSMSKDIIM